MEDEIEVANGINSKVKDGVIPLDLCKRAAMKLDSFLTDIYEVLEDPDLDENQKYDFSLMTELGSVMITRIVNIVRKEMNEEELLTNDIDIGEFDEYPVKEPSIFDDII